MTLATIGNWLPLLLIWPLALGWVWQWLLWVRHAPKLVDLTKLGDARLGDAGVADSQNLPQVAVIVPACNEAASIAKTLESLLRSEGVALEILAVNDRSTDATGERMEEVAARELDKNSPVTLQVIHIDALPDGWLGKPHALATAAQLAKSDWLLFTDGDVTFAPEAVSLALGYAVAEHADHLVLMPDWIMDSYGEAAMHGAMHALSTWTLRLWRVADPAARDFLGVGAFNLIRRSTYEAVGGFEGLRMEVLEDLRLGWKVKRAGFRQRVALGPGLASVRWAEGAWGVVRNLEKNLFALYRFKLGITIFACLGLAVQILLPLLALALGGWARLGAVVLYAAVAAIYGSSRKVTRVPPGYFVLYPLAASLFLFAMVRSTVLALTRGGVLWRGTLYSLKELRANAGRFW